MLFAVHARVFAAFGRRRRDRGQDAAALMRRREREARREHGQRLVVRGTPSP